MVSIIVPIWNNADTLPGLAARVAEALSGEDWELVCINDGSRDSSLAVLRRLAQDEPRLKVVSLSRNFGQHPATRAGMDVASGDEIVFMDADLQDRPEDIPRLLARLRDETSPVDAVYTVKAERHDSPLTRLTSKLFHRVHARMTGQAAPEGLGTFRAFRRRLLTEMLRYDERNIVYGPLMLSMGYSCDYLAVSHDERRHGKSGYNFSRRLALAMTTLMRHTDIPHRLFLGLGGFVVAASVLYAAFNILQYMIYGRVLMGGLAVIILLLLFFMGATFVALGLMGLYIFQIFQEVLRRPRYHVAETLNLPHDSHA